MAKFKVQEMQSSLLQVKHILSISWFHKVTPRASCVWYLEFYWPGHNFKTNANLAMKGSPKIETYESLPGVKF